ncbi:unnamed protein product, partial [Mesorhabditis belari]|uniref:VWFA domain-containing protein n=1 Tax=Mesorhabditis belari TaxID=2138241 RepID=A0AAF3EHS5_9BILA
MQLQYRSNLNMSTTNDDPTMHAVFLLDITGSMSNELEGMKETVSLFVQNINPESNVKIHVWTFTESSQGCYVSKSPDVSLKELVQYVKKIQLCRPPDQPHINASGDDGPENVLAAVGALKESFDEMTNILCFVITDDKPHLLENHSGRTYRHEQDWLRAKGFQTTDAYEILNDISTYFQITFIPIIGQQAEACHWYHQAANTTNGLVLSMSRGRGSALEFANGLLALLARMPGFEMKSEEVVDPEEDFERLKAYTIITPEAQLVVLEQDNRQSTQINVKHIKNSDEFQFIFENFIELTNDKFGGKRAAKRSRIADESILKISAQLAVRIVQHSVNAENSGIEEQSQEQIEQQFTELLNELKVMEKRNKFNNLAYPYGAEVARIEWLRKNWKSFSQKIQLHTSTLDSQNSLLKCIYSFCTIADALTECDHLTEIGKLKEILYCKAIDVRFPVNNDGEPDFYDSWNLSFKGLEHSDILQVASAIDLVNSQKREFVFADDDEEYYDEEAVTEIKFKDAMSSTERNAFLLIAHPDDLLVTAIYHLVTSFPMLSGFIQSNLVSGGSRIFPSLLIGLQSSALCSLLNKKAFNSTKIGEIATIKKFPVLPWRLIRTLKWSILQNADHKVVRYIADAVENEKGFRAGDPIPKIISGIMYFFAKQHDSATVWTNLFVEIAGEFASKIETARKSKHHFPSAKEICEVILGEDGVTNGFDCLKSIHPIERLIVGKKAIDFSNKRHKLEEFLKDNFSLKRLANYFYLICDSLEFDSKIENQNALELSFRDRVDQKDLLKIFVDSLMLGSRTERYVDEGKKDNVWIRLDEKQLKGKLERCALQLVKEVYDSDKKKWNFERTKVARSTLISELLKIPIHSISTPTTSETISQIDVEISKISWSLEDEVFQLKRSDFLEIFEALKEVNDEKRLAVMLPVLCMGKKWTTESASMLKRQQDEIEKALSSPLIDPLIKTQCLQEIRSKPVCLRVYEEKGCNRHGHHSKNFYPGLNGWTEEYAKERLRCHKPCVYLEKKLNDLKHFTELTSNYRSKTFGKVRKAMIECVLNLDISPQQIEIVEKLLKEIEKADWIDTKFVEITDAMNETKILSSTVVRSLRRRVRRCREKHIDKKVPQTCFCQAINL